MPEYNAPLSPTALVNQLVAELTELADYLTDPSQQRIVKMFCDIMLNNRTAISDATTLLPLEAALFVIQVEEHRNTNYEVSELHKRMGELERELENLKRLLNDKA